MSAPIMEFGDGMHTLVQDQGSLGEPSFFWWRLRIVATATRVTVRWGVGDRNADMAVGEGLFEEPVRVMMFQRWLQRLVFHCAIQVTPA